MIRVYKYVCKLTDPAADHERIESQLRLAHDYHNELITIALDHRKRLREKQNELSGGNLALMQREFDSLTLELKRIYGLPKSDRPDTKKEKERKRELLTEIKKIRETTKPLIKIEAETLNEKFRTETRRLRNEYSASPRLTSRGPIEAEKRLSSRDLTHPQISAANMPRPH
jgi:hypothetical protein